MIAPTHNMMPPLTLVRTGKRAFKPRMTPGAELMAIAADRNGTANPAEYVANSNAARSMLLWPAAMVRMAPRIGPTHGDQPAAKVTPIRKDEAIWPDGIW